MVLFLGRDFGSIRGRGSSVQPSAAAFLRTRRQGGGGLLAGRRLTGGPAVAVRSNVSAASVLFHWLDLSDPLAGSPGAKYCRISARTAGVRWAKWSRSRRRTRSA